MKNVLLLLPTETYRAEAFVQAANKLDLRLVVASQKRQAMSNQMKNRTLVVSMSDPALGANQIEAASKLSPIDAIVSVDDGGLKTASVASARLGLKHVSSSSVVLAQNKIAMRQALAKASLRQPRSAILHSGDQVDEIVSHLGGFPVVTKPASLSGSIGVIRANSQDQLSLAIQTTREIQQIHGCPTDADIIIEEYIPGEEYAIDAVISNDKMVVTTIFEKPQPLVGPYFAETIYVTPTQLGPQQSRYALDCVDQARKALGIDTGPIHCEIRIDPSNTIYIIEIAARSIGGRCSKAIPLRNQLTLEEIILMEATGMKMPEIALENQASGVFMIPVPRAGVIRTINGIEAAKRVPWITDVDISVTINTEVAPIPYDSKYIGFIFAKAPTSKLVTTALEKAHKLIELEIS